jgi:hypothetical protein
LSAAPPPDFSIEISSNRGRIAVNYLCTTIKTPPNPGRRFCFCVVASNAIRRS